MATSTKQFPTADKIYAARFNEGLTWSEMRSHFAVKARSSKFLSECVAFVNASEELLKKHPEMALIAVGGETYEAVGAEARATIRAERERGVGLAMLRERTGLSMGVLRKIVGEEVGTTSRVAWGARYTGKVAKPEGEAEGEAKAPEVKAPEAEAKAPEAAKPAPKRRSRAKKPAAA